MYGQQYCVNVCAQMYSCYEQRKSLRQKEKGHSVKMFQMQKPFMVAMDFV